jgi:GDP-L-fucose synthase
MLLEVYESLRMHDSGVLLVNPIANCGYPGESNDYEENTFWDGPIHESVLAYGFTRRMIDVLSRCYAAQYGLDSANFFVPNMYGPHDSTDPEKTHALNALVLRTVKARYEGTPSITLWGSGSPVREWLFAPDFGRFLVSFLESGKRTISINVAQNHGLSIKDLMGLVVQRAAYQGTVEWDRSKQDGAPYKTMNDRQFRAIFPDFRFTTLDDGIDATVEYYKSVYPF